MASQARPTSPKIRVIKLKKKGHNRTSTSPAPHQRKPTVVKLNLNLRSSTASSSSSNGPSTFPRRPKHNGRSASTIPNSAPRTTPTIYSPKSMPHLKHFQASSLSPTRSSPPRSPTMSPRLATIPSPRADTSRLSQLSTSSSGSSYSSNQPNHSYSKSMASMGINGNGQLTQPHTNGKRQYNSLESPLTSLSSTSSQERSTPPKCPMCEKPVVDDALSIENHVYHRNHFVCLHCRKKLDPNGGWYLYAKKPYCAEDYNELYAEDCAGCMKKLKVDTDDVVQALNKQWHSHCLACSDCKEPLKDIYRHKQTQALLCRTHYLQHFGQCCAGCGMPLTGRILKALDEKWHNRCFACAACQRELAREKFYVKNDNIYCHADYQELFATRCSRCEEIIHSGRFMNYEVFDEDEGKKFNAVHLTCFTCVFCEANLEGCEFFVDGDDIYCRKDYEDLLSVCCAVCEKFIQGTVVHALNKQFHRECFKCVECNQPPQGNFIEEDGRIRCEEHLVLTCTTLDRNSYVELGPPASISSPDDSPPPPPPPVFGDPSPTSISPLHLESPFPGTRTRSSGAPYANVEALYDQRQPYHHPNTRQQNDSAFGSGNGHDNTHPLHGTPEDTISTSLKSDSPISSKFDPFATPPPSTSRKTATPGITPTEKPKLGKNLDFFEAIANIDPTEAGFGDDEKPKLGKNIDFFEAIADIDPNEAGFGDDADDEAGALSMNEHRNARIHNAYDLSEFLRLGMRKSYSNPLSKVDNGQVSRFRADYKNKEIYRDLVCQKLTYTFQDYAPSVFHNIRKQYGIAQQDFISSLCDHKIRGGGTGAGKSGMLFFFSKDNRFIIKTISRPELKYFRQILKRYHRHIITNRHTLLSRFYALHKIHLPNQNPIRFIIMNNVFETKLSISERFDLKGSIRNRMVHEEELKEMGKNPVLKDLNFTSKIYVGDEQRKALRRQIEKDSEFLQKSNIMDYSILLGIHTSSSFLSPPGSCIIDCERLDDPLYADNNKMKSIFQIYEGGICGFQNGQPSTQVYFMGIIDILQEFNLRKKVESTYKAVKYNKDAISATEAKHYAQRFRQFFDKKIE